MTIELIEEVYLEISASDKPTQDMGSSFMAHFGISDKKYTEEITERIPKLGAVPYLVSRKLLIYEMFQPIEDCEKD